MAYWLEERNYLGKKMLQCYFGILFSFVQIVNWGSVNQNAYTTYIDKWKY